MEILNYPDSSLRRKAQLVERFDDELRQIVAQMAETMVRRDGLGLAAPQVGVDLRLIILDPCAFEGEERGKPPIVLINPELIWSDEVQIKGEEGCLSFPGVFVKLKRPKALKIRALSLDQEQLELEAEGLGARALFHEMDHLDGVVMIDHLSPLLRRRALKKHQRNQKLREQMKRED